MTEKAKTIYPLYTSYAAGIVCRGYYDAAVANVAAVAVVNNAVVAIITVVEVVDVTPEQWYEASGTRAPS